MTALLQVSSKRVLETGQIDVGHHNCPSVRKMYLFLNKQMKRRATEACSDVLWAMSSRPTERNVGFRLFGERVGPKLEVDDLATSALAGL